MEFCIPSATPITPKDFGVFKVYLDEHYVWLVMDRPGKSENAIGQDFQASIIDAAEYITAQHKQGACKVCILTSAKKRFCVGADVNEFYHSTDKAALKELLAAGKAAMKQIADLPMPTIAAINGDALGGGLEIALLCDHRVAAALNTYNLGLPEVMLGVLPGLGGTVRTPRLIGIQKALAYILAGKSMKPSTAKAIGLVDKLLDATEQPDGSNRFLVSVREYAATVVGRRKTGLRSKAGWIDWFLGQTPVGRYIVTQQTVKMLNKNTKGKYPAPYRAFETIMASITEPNVDKALELESQAFADVCITPQCKSLMSLFFLQERCKKLDSQSAHFQPGDVLPVNTIGVFGTSDMALGIMQLLLKKKMNGVLWGTSVETLIEAKAAIESQFASEVKLKRMDKGDSEAALGHLKTVLRWKDLKGCQLIIDATPGSTEEKSVMLKELVTAEVLSDDTVFASVDDLISIAAIATDIECPGSIVGLHFFNPVTRVPCAEVVKGPQSSARAVATAYKLALDWGKFPVVVNDGPGFLVHRMLSAYIAEACQMVTEGASPEVVDKTLQDFGCTLGPFRLVDETGFGRAVGWVRAAFQKEGSHVPWCDLLDALDKNQDLGKSAGRGFYSYVKDKPVGLDHGTMKLLGVSVDTKFDRSEIVNRCILVMVNTAAVLLENKRVTSPEDVDTAMVFATGFAPWRGGLLGYADSQGIAGIVTTLRDLTQRHGERYTPAPLLVQMAADGSCFFPDRPKVPPPEPRQPKVHVAYFTNGALTQTLLAAATVAIAALVYRMTI